ncbi:hypothetical protein FQR65_LT04654 [Abscondita terminalis]|nr:hypothetical protein FQR65_LT04654 [Abscondita terminalis]
MIIFRYTIPAFIRGSKKKFSSEDIYDISSDQKSDQLGSLAAKLWSDEITNADTNGKQPSLSKLLIKMFGRQFLCLTIMVGVKELLIQMCIPIALGGLISAYSTHNTFDVYTYAAYLITCCLANFLFPSCVYLETQNLDLKVQISCSCLIYQKILKLNKSALGRTTPGQIINHLSNDIAIFDNAVLFLSYLWIVPVQAIAILCISYKEIGTPAVFGMCFTLCFFPILFLFGKLAAKYHLRTLVRRDERLRLMNEILQGIDIIKMYAWEQPFAKLISFHRKLEVKAIRNTIYSKATSHFHTMFITTSLFVTFATSNLFGFSINAKNAFIITTYFSVFCSSFMLYLPTSIAVYKQVQVVVKRITMFLLSSELQHRCVNGNSEYAVSITNATVKLDNSKDQDMLTDLTVNFKFGFLTAVIGPVGCGKSSLLQVILQELPLTNGKLNVNGVLSYSSQEAWLFSGSVQQNILFGNQMNIERYDKVIKCCALEKDFNLFPHGDKTIVGEKGASLSGGQKARINLARAIYRDADIYLLDDPLSAVDTHVGKHIFEECIRTVLKDKTVILVTHQLQYLKYVDHIIVLDRGCLKVEGSPIKLEQTSLDFVKFLKKHQEEEEHEKNEREKENLVAYEESANETIKTEEITSNSKSILLPIYKKYLQACNCTWLIIVTISCFLGTQTLISLSFYFIAYWVKEEREHSSPNDENVRTMKMYVYCTITLTAIVLGVLRVVTYVNVSMRSSISIHKNMFSKLIRAPLRFFTINSSGRVLNRFSKDLSIVDDALPTFSLIALRIFSNAIGVLVVICIITPWFIIPTVVVCLLFFLSRKIYVSTTLDVFRVESICRSPIYNHANTSMQGLQTIRVFGVQNMLISEFNRFLDKRSSVYFLSMSLSKAMSFWIDGICFLLACFVVIYFVFNKESTGEGVGLAISQIFQLSGQLAWGIKQLTDVESCMISVERLLEYCAIKPEENTEKLKPTDSWPENGKIQFMNVSLKYSESEQYVLKNLNFVIKSEEKVGIVGRTGAGKSSTIGALFQLVKTEGAIVVDDVNIQHISLNNLRRKISIIPQDPVLFTGTIRSNLDPFNEYADEVLWKALEEIRLKYVIDKLGSGLNSEITQNGANLSVGERQLICLARAIIRNNKILILDEATANVDLQTDDLIQKTIRNKFKNCTVLTVAHRLKTIMDSDKVLVMEAGEILEYEHPYILLQNNNGAFYSMVQETDKTMANILTSIAKKSYGRTNSQ